MYALHNILVQRQQRTILAIPELVLPAHGLTVILGHNGSGKSTLLKLLAGQLAPDHGQILLDGQSVRRYRPGALARKVAYMPQQIPQPPLLSVRELVELGRFAWRGWLRRWSPDDLAHVDAALDATDVAHLAGHAVDRISGGERQRAWLAMLLAQASPCLLLDEPSAALDLAHQYQLLALLRREADRNGHAVIAILHDLNLALRYADRILALRQGQIWFDGSPEVLLAHPALHQLYDIALDILPREGKHPVAVVA
ncbi:ABC transporter ATP-binding protein [Chitinilyticum piscinae]|uniref:ABC transporter ATP-binding protein n=1 Tax=Chitinilyticum piscinae TaxID=2866724 RepID=A0A8J7FM54_9NEIS|nr:ABC transporter ATP-binding protein [Chitinilyticum piscinae]MBE9610637.1 ABC transporter ATP-binding protein [Chitinilyticum piscinae]